mmetsp:Transcript_10843/g.19656  ORF Transcript_10843/g.19656 Transcript_10843/m.19656 type:complete len:96 (-) Transcript_10843:471-758(-)
MKAIGVDASSPAFAKMDFFTVHECLRLHYEEALTRMDSTTGRRMIVLLTFSGLENVLISWMVRTLDLFVELEIYSVSRLVTSGCSPEELIRITSY